MIVTEQDQLSNEDLDAQRKLQKCEIQLNRVKEELSSLKANKFDLTSQLNVRNQKKQQLEDALKRF